MVERKARQAVVRIVALRVEPDDRRGKLAAGRCRRPGRRRRGLRVGRSRFGSRPRPSRRARRPGSSSFAVPSKNVPVHSGLPSWSRSSKTRIRSAGGPLITRGPEVRVALDDQDAAALVDRDPRGRDDLGLGGDSLEHQPRIERSRRRSQAGGTAPAMADVIAIQRPRSCAVHEQEFSDIKIRAGDARSITAAPVRKAKEPGTGHFVPSG